MPSLGTGLVDITRDFLLAYQLVRRLLERHRAGTLRFEELQELAGDSEASVLFRLKEHCHALFRQRARTGDPAMTRGALFDLAVGSLFHEAMKLRENFYQWSSYGPKVRELRAAAGPDAERLFEEFEKILSASKTRIEEAFQETETLLEQTRDLFAALLAAHRANGLVARYLLENASLVEQVLGEPIDSVLARIHGDTLAGYVLASDSYLASGFYGEARRTLAEALRREPDRPDLERRAAYAAGMQAYLDGRYDESLDRLERWLEAKPVAEEVCLASIAHAALTRLGMLVQGSRLEGETERAAALVARIDSWLTSTGHLPAGA